MSACDRIEDPWFVSAMMDGLCALILFAMMAACPCSYCTVHRWHW